MGLLSQFIRRDAQSLSAADQIPSSVRLADCEPEDCSTCTDKYPRSLSIDTETPLWGTAPPWQLHVLCATGKTDWVHSVTDEDHTLARRVHLWAGNDGRAKGTETVLVSNTSMDPGDAYLEYEEDGDPENKPARVLVLPWWIYIDNATPRTVASDLDAVMAAVAQAQEKASSLAPQRSHSSSSSNSEPESGFDFDSENLQPITSPLDISLPLTSSASIRTCPDRAIILLCSHRTRDKRCAVTSTILHKHFSAELRRLDLLRDAADDRPGGVRVQRISHVGGHRFAANVLVYTKKGAAVWLARVKPSHVKRIVEHTVLRGEAFPELLRGAFKSNPIEF